MRSKFIGYVIALTVGLAVSSSVASAEPRGHGKTPEAGDKNMDKQMEWEKKVMGDDSAKSADKRKIANAQKLADEAAKHPAPVQAPKPKDPSKEGVHAKQEASIGLSVPEEEARVSKKHGNSKKAESASSNDELGALVATSLAEEKSPDLHANAKAASTGTAKGKGHAKAPARANSLDQMFATSKD